MKAEERRKQILEFFRGQSGPVSASALADRFSVSRQIIVGDVALLRASGMNIEATPRGYILTEEQKKGILRRVACVHNREQMEDELNICVDYGCEVLNVIVEHPVYGQLTGELHLQSRYDVAQFGYVDFAEQVASVIEYGKYVLVALAYQMEPSSQRKAVPADTAGSPLCRQHRPAALML